MATHQVAAQWTGHALNGSAASQAEATQNSGETPEQLEERRTAWGMYYAAQLQSGQPLTPEQHQIAAHYLQTQAASQPAASPSAAVYQHGAGATGGYNNYSAYYPPHASSSYNCSSGCAQQTGHVIGGTGGLGSHYQQQHLQYQQYQQQQYQEVQRAYQQQQQQQQWQKTRQAQQGKSQQPHEPEPPQHRGSGADLGSSAGGLPTPPPSLTQPSHNGVGVASCPVSVHASIAAAAAHAAAKIRACQEAAGAAAASPAFSGPRSAQALPQTSDGKAKYGLTPIRTAGLNSSTPGPRSCSSLPSPAAPSPAHPEPVQWPAALRDWIERSFAQCDNDVTRKIVEDSMKKRIGAVDLWGHNWEREPLALATRKKEPRKEMWYPGCPEDLAERSPPRRERGTRGYGDAFGSGDSPLGGKKGKRHKAGKGWDKGWGKGWDSAPLRDAGRDEGYMVTSDERGKRDRRASRFEGSGLTLSERADRWSAAQPSAAGAPTLAEPGGGGDIELDFTVQGTSTVVEKKYLRLTSAPDPRTVRPEPVLRQALDRIRQRIVEFGDLHGQEQYMYLWEQMKSVRQDLTVQRIRNEFTVEVYEMHARICLEYNDQAELKQCQAQLAQLYEEGLGTPQAQREFLAYNLLYNIGQQADNNVADLMRDMNPNDRKDNFICHALKVRAAAALGHYVSFFRLYAEAPGHAAYVMDTFIGRERFSALRVICRGYMPTIPVSVVASQLAFEDAAECGEWLEDHGADLSEDGAQLDCKQSKGKLVEHSISIKLEEERKAAERRAENLNGLKGWA